VTPITYNNKLVRARVWWMPQVPGNRFDVDVTTVEEARLLLRVLADYDLFQFENRIKPDYCNAGGLVYWDEAEEEWFTWENEDGREVDDQ
jgi:hypothetical protein